MSRNVSLGELASWARQISDTENDPNVTTAEVKALINRHLTEVYDRLVDAGPADYYAATTQITTSSGLIEYPLEVDFRNLLYVYVRESTDERRPLRDMPSGTRGRYKAPSGSWTLDVEYIPVPPTLEDDSDTFDGVSGWEELIVNLVARDIMTKRQDDPSVPMANVLRLEARVTARSRARDKGAPKRITDLDEVYATPYPNGWTGSSRLACYRLRAGNLELFEPLWGLPT